MIDEAYQTDFPTLRHPKNVALIYRHGTHSLTGFLFYTPLYVQHFISEHIDIVSDFRRLSYQEHGNQKKDYSFTPIFSAALRFSRFWLILLKALLLIHLLIYNRILLHNLYFDPSFDLSSILLSLFPSFRGILSFFL